MVDSKEMNLEAAVEKAQELRERGKKEENKGEYCYPNYFARKNSGNLSLCTYPFA